MNNAHRGERTHGLYDKQCLPFSSQKISSTSHYYAQVVNYWSDRGQAVWRASTICQKKSTSGQEQIPQLLLLQNFVNS